MLNIDYVKGLASPRLLLRILKDDPAACSIKKIIGYTTEALEKVSDADILTRAKQLASILGEGWTASIRHDGVKRFVELVRP